jgi:radical SAM protein with 4Fe4S-binding SPASM domain
LPLAYYLELTPACNNRCPGCGNVYASRRENLARPLDGAGWLRLLARLAKHARHLKLTGGEPTLHPAFDAIVRGIDELGLPFTLFTNARWQRPAALLELLCDSAACEGLLVSLHGPDAAAHQAFSGVPGSFDETCANVRRASAAGLDVAASLVINRHNWDRVAATLALALDLGANSLVCNRLLGPPTDLAPSQAQLRAAIAAVEGLRAQGQAIRFGNCIPQCFAPSSSRGCAAGSAFATVDPWGRLRPCNHTDLVAGDLLAQPIEQVWQGALMNYWRALAPPDCAACPAWAACHGGCRAQALLAGDQDPLIQDPPLKQKLPEIELALYDQLRPQGRFERNGGILVHKSQALALPAAYQRLTSKLDGSLNLRQIERQYNAAALDWIGALCQAGMVTWADCCERRTDQ